MKSAVIVFPGSNCDRDVKVALAASAGTDPLMVWHRETEFPKVDLIVVPGGFSYGDYLRAGSMAANSPAMVETIARVNSGVPVLGICNGFQILCESGLLPGALMRNAGLKFICRDIWLRVDAIDTCFTNRYRAGQISACPSPIMTVITSPIQPHSIRWKAMAGLRSVTAMPTAWSMTTPTPTGRRVISPGF